MEINFDFLISGCNTRCRHCYVHGGPGALMPVEDVLLCMERLDAMAESLPPDTSFTLDHEPMNHPFIEEIIAAAAGTRFIKNDHHGMTTGLALMRRSDRDEVVRAYFDSGYDEFGITLHGAVEHHDEIVRRKGAFRMTVAAAEYLKSKGARLNVSLMMNRFFLEDAEEITALLDRLKPDEVWFVTPIYTPHAGMQDFEPYRATLDMLEQLRCRLPDWRQDAEAVLAKAAANTMAAAAKRLGDGAGLRALFAAPQSELYLTIHQDCRLYVGNSGGETRLLGDLRMLDPKGTAGIISALSGNRDYGAYYDVEALPPTQALVRKMEALPQTLIYGDFESALYRGLAALGVPTRIIKPDACIIC